VLVALLLIWRAQSGSAAKARAGAKGAIPVVADSVRVRDFPVHLAALGTVTALRTVTVRSRVDGQLISVNFKEGQIVKAGQLLAVIDSQPFEAQVQQVQAQLARDSAQLDNARIDLDRYQHLLDLDSAPKQQVDTQNALVRQYEAQVRLDQAAVKSATLQLGYTHITAEFAGRVGLRAVDAGNIVHAADPGGITVITQLEPISVLFSIPQSSLPDLLQRFRSGEPLPVSLSSGDTQTPLGSGRVAAIDNEIDPTTGTVKVRAEFPNSDQTLFPNQFVNVSVLVRRIPGALVVPSAAVQRGSVGTFTYAVGSGDTVHVRQVTVGPTENDFAVITDGLEAGDRVIVDGVDRLRDGATVKIQPPASQRNFAGGKGHGHWAGAAGGGGAQSGAGGGAGTKGGSGGNGAHRGKPGRVPGGQEAPGN